MLELKSHCFNEKAIQEKSKVRRPTKQIYTDETSGVKYHMITSIWGIIFIAFLKVHRLDF